MLGKRQKPASSDGRRGSRLRTESVSRMSSCGKMRTPTYRFRRLLQRPNGGLANCVCDATELGRLDAGAATPNKYLSKMALAQLRGITRALTRCGGARWVLCLTMPFAMGSPIGRPDGDLPPRGAQLGELGDERSPKILSPPRRLPSPRQAGRRQGENGASKKEENEPPPLLSGSLVLSRSPPPHCGKTRAISPHIIIIAGDAAGPFE